MNTEIMFSSASDMWATPVNFFQKLNEVFRFDTDVCATQENSKCEIFFSPEQDGLKQEWTGNCWMNPPYGRCIGQWVKKAYLSGKNGATVVCLLPARTDTKWWHDYCRHGEIHFVSGRLKFGESKNSAPFPCVLVVFRPNLDDVFGAKK